MPTVTQDISNYLGGVSQQNDELKLPGQLRSCINAYPEPTFGLIKRPGGKFVAELKDASGNLISPTTYDGGKWFSIFRDTDEQYVCVIKGTDIKIWGLLDGAPKTVTYASGSQTYLTGSKDDYDVLTINDYTFITNKKVTVTTKAAPSYTFGTKATLRLLEVEYASKYEVTVNSTTVSYTTFNIETPVSSPSQTVSAVTADAILTSLLSSLGGISGITATRIGNTIELSSSSVFTITAKGGKDGEGMVAYQDAVDNVARLPNQSINGRIFKVTNTVNVEDDYYVKFVANTGSSGLGYWEETIKPDVSLGLTEATMPHQLIRNANGTFTFKEASWEPRLVGDDSSNEHPSFVGSKIQQLFFYNNRLGALTEENVSLSQAGDYLNFYHNSALTVIASDPIDVSCSSIRPAILYAVVPVPQGLLLFSRSQQFLLQTAQGILTPTGTSIKTISNYEMDSLNMPIDMGTTTAFISKTPSYTRVFEMQTRGQEESPLVVDISRVVPEWIPSTIDQVVSSPQNSVLSLGSSNSRNLYLFRFYSNGETRELQSWFKWTMSGPVQYHTIDRDVMWSVSKQDQGYVIQKIALVQSPTTGTLVTSAGVSIDPRLDIWSPPSSKTYNSNPADKYTKAYLPFKHNAGLKLCLLVSSNGSSLNDSGLVLYPTVYQDGGGYYAKVPNLDLTGDDLVVGYTYDMDIELPQTYYRTAGDVKKTDYTASLTLARYKFIFGTGGDVFFLLKSRGRSDWDARQGVLDADYYKANDIPVLETAQYTVPIYQRSENIQFRVFSDSPFPVSLISMKWEGNYSPRFYTRR